MRLIFFQYKLMLKQINAVTKRHGAFVDQLHQTPITPFAASQEQQLNVQKNN